MDSVMWENKIKFALLRISSSCFFLFLFFSHPKKIFCHIYNIFVCRENSFILLYYKEIEIYIYSNFTLDFHSFLFSLATTGKILLSSIFYYSRKKICIDRKLHHFQNKNFLLKKIFSSFSFHHTENMLWQYFVFAIIKQLLQIRK